MKTIIENKNVIIVEDIVDTGRTLKKVCEILKSRSPHSFKVVSFLDKPKRRVVDFKADYVLFTIPDTFIYISLSFSRSSVFIFTTGTLYLTFSIFISFFKSIFALAFTASYYHILTILKYSLHQSSPQGNIHIHEQTLQYHLQTST
mgnify:CR=1 FL=1